MLGQGGSGILALSKFAKHKEQERGQVTPPRIFFDFFLDEGRRREYFLGITSFTSH